MNCDNLLTNLSKTLGSEQFELLAEFVKDNMRAFKDHDIEYVHNFLAFWIFYNCGPFSLNQDSTLEAVSKCVYLARLNFLKKIINKQNVFLPHDNKHSQMDSILKNTGETSGVFYMLTSNRAGHVDVIDWDKNSVFKIVAIRHIEPFFIFKKLNALPVRDN
jgi:hypothetical protein